MHAVCPQHNTFLYFTGIYACVRMQDHRRRSSHAEYLCMHLRCVCDNLHEHTCMSVMYMPNLNCIHVDIHMNRKPRMMV